MDDKELAEALLASWGDVVGFDAADDLAKSFAKIRTMERARCAVIVYRAADRAEDGRELKAAAMEIEGL